MSQTYVGHPGQQCSWATPPFQSEFIWQGHLGAGGGGPKKRCSDHFPKNTQRGWSARELSRGALHHVKFLRRMTTEYYPISTHHSQRTAYVATCHKIIVAFMMHLYYEGMIHCLYTVYLSIGNSCTSSLEVHICYSLLHLQVLFPINFETRVLHFSLSLSLADSKSESAEMSTQEQHHMHCSCT
jgi:hypothetical protein